MSIWINDSIDLSDAVHADSVHIMYLMQLYLDADRDQRKLGDCCNIYSTASHGPATSTQISRNLAWTWYTSHLLNHCEILHRARQYHSRALCKISQWFNDSENVTDRRDFARIQIKNFPCPHPPLIHLYWSAVSHDYLHNIDTIDLLWLVYWCCLFYMVV